MLLLGNPVDVFGEILRVNNAYCSCKYHSHLILVVFVGMGRRKQWSSTHLLIVGGMVLLICLTPVCL